MRQFKELLRSRNIQKGPLRNGLRTQRSAETLPHQALKMAALMLHRPSQIAQPWQTRARPTKHVREEEGRGSHTKPILEALATSKRTGPCSKQPPQPSAAHGTVSSCGTGTKLHSTQDHTLKTIETEPLQIGLLLWSGLLLLECEQH